MNPRVRDTENMAAAFAELEKRVRVVEALASKAGTAIPWTRNEHIALPDQTSFGAIWERIVRIQLDVITCRLTLTNGTSGTYEVRLRDATSGATTSAASVGTGLTRDILFEWAHGIDPGSLAFLVLETRRVGGAVGLGASAEPPFQSDQETLAAVPTALASGNPQVI